MKPPQKYIITTWICFCCLFIFCFQTVHSYASYTESINEIRVIYETEPVNLTWIYESINNESIISHDGTIWYINASIRLYSDGEGSTCRMYLNNTEATELRLSNYYNNVGLYASRYYIENVTILSWNHDENRPAHKDEKQVGITIDRGILRNCNLTNLESIGVNSPIEDVYNIYINDSKKGIIANSLDNRKIHDIRIENLTGSAIEVYESNNTEVYDIVISHAGDYLHPGTGRHAVLFSDQCYNSSIHDIFSNGTGWSSIDVTGDSSYIDIYDITVYNSGHNGLDIHWGNHITVTNMSIYESMSNNALVTCALRGYLTHDILLKNIYTRNASVISYLEGGSKGAGILVGTGAANVTIINYTSVDDGGGVMSINTLNLTIFNITSTSALNGVSFTKDSGYKRGVYNSTIIDSNLYGQESYDITLWYSNNTKMINVNYDPTKYRAIYGANPTMYYYADFFVKDTNDNPIDKASVNMVDEQESMLTNLNGYGTQVREFETDIYGKTALPNTERINSPILAEFHDLGNGTRIYYNWTITAKKLNGTTINSTDIYGNMPGTDSTYNLIHPDGNITHYTEYLEGNITNIHPNISWYRQDPNTPPYTFEIILDKSRTLGDIVSWELLPENDIITCTSATNHSITISTNTSDNPFWLNNTIPSFADNKLTLLRDGKYYRNTTADTSGSVSFYIDEEFTTHIYMLEQSSGDIIIHAVNQIGTPVENARIYLNYTNTTNIRTVHTYPGDLYELYPDAGSYIFDAYSTEHAYTISIDEPDHSYNITETITTNPQNTTYITLRTVDSCSPSTITNLINSSKNTYWIYWTWTNPTDYDFSKVEIWLNGTNIANTTSNRYNATGLEDGTDYQISLRTVDDCGNINTTWMNSTIRTDGDPAEYQTPTDPDSVTYNSYYPRISVSDTSIIYNIPRLYATLVEKYGESEVQENMLNETQEKIWVLKALLGTPSYEPFYINSTTVEELRFAKGSSGYAISGEIYLDRTKLSGWNETENRYCDYDHSCSLAAKIYGNITNTEFQKMSKIYWGYDDGENPARPIDGLFMQNVTIKGNGKGGSAPIGGLTVNPGNNLLIDNITFLDSHPIFGNGFRGCNMNNSVIENIRVINVSDYNNPATGAYGLQVGGYNNRVSNVFINGTAWSGTNIGGRYNIYSNITVLNSGHNGFEFQSSDSIARNITVMYSDSNNFFTSTHPEPGEYGGTNITYDTIYSVDTGSGVGIRISEASLNIIIQNGIFEGESGDITESENVTIINCTQRNAFYGILNTIALPESYTYNGRHKIIDSEYKNNSYKDMWFNKFNDSIVLNTNFSTKRLDTGDFTNNYYLNIHSKDSEGNTLPYAQIIISNDNITDISSINGYGIQKERFYTDYNGISYSPDSDRSNSPAIAEYKLDSCTGYIYLNWTIIAKKLNGTVTNDTYIYADIPDTYEGYNRIYPDGNIEHQTQYIEGNVTGIHPNSTWYRIDPNTPTNTINITLNQTKNLTATSWTIQPINSQIIAQHATSTSITLTSDTENNPVWLNNTNLNFTSRLICLMRNSTQYSNSTADESGNISFYYTGNFSTWEFSLEILEYCGDSICNNGETCSSCPTDCGTCPTDPPSGSSSSSSSGVSPGITIPITTNETNQTDEDNQITGHTIDINITTDDNNSTTINQTQTDPNTPIDNPPTTPPIEEEPNSTIKYIAIAVVIILVSVIIIAKAHKNSPKDTKPITTANTQMTDLEIQKRKLEEINQYISYIRPIITRMIIENQLEAEFEKRLDDIDEENEQAIKMIDDRNPDIINKIQVLIDHISELKQDIESRNK